MGNHSGSADDHGQDRRQDLSALLDGELSPDGVDRVSAAWRHDASTRQAWHAYGLIGDVMRSDDLASDAAHDERFLQSLRARLASEPVILAPSSPRMADAQVPASPITRIPEAVPVARRSWKTPMAVAAGFLVAMGAMVAIQAPRDAGSDVPMMAAAPVVAVPGSAPISTIQVSASPGPEQVAVGAQPDPLGPVIRDPGLDRYLLAHKQFSGSSALGAPSGFLRNAAAEVPDR